MTGPGQDSGGPPASDEFWVAWDEAPKPAAVPPCGTAAGNGIRAIGAMRSVGKGPREKRNPGFGAGRGAGRSAGLGAVRSAGLHPRLRLAGTALLDLVAPQTCIYCDQSTDAPEAICGVCFAEFERNTAACPRCALPDVGGSTCSECLQHRWSLDRIIAPYVYDPAIAYLLQRWKYEKQRYCAEIAGKMLVSGSIEAEHDAIFLATPLHWWRQLQRGFNQSEDLLTSACRRLGRIPCRPAERDRIRLRRARATPKQSLASRAARLKNLEAAFQVSGVVAGRSVVLVDDVCTTGATGEAMAAVLKAAGAVSVTLWCLARTPRPG